MSLIENPTVIPRGKKTVELDESLFSRRKKNNIGKIYPEQWVFVGHCRETKESFLYAVPDRSAPTLIPIIGQCKRPGFLMCSDEWKTYNKLVNECYHHELMSLSGGTQKRGIKANV